MFNQYRRINKHNQFCAKGVGFNVFCVLVGVVMYGLLTKRFRSKWLDSGQVFSFFPFA